MLDEIAKTVGIEKASEDLFNPTALEALTLASGGVARDFLTIFVAAIDIAVSNKSKWVTPTNVWQAAASQSYKTKLPSMKKDAGNELSALEKVYSDLIEYCLGEKKKTAFLIQQTEVQKYPYEHELIQQLMDLKLIHVIELDTSASSGRSGRYEAYTLDFSTFMEPRLRNIEHVEFWKNDEQRRRKGLRESPVYSLERAKNSHTSVNAKKIETSLENIRSADGNDNTHKRPKTGDLFNNINQPNNP